MCIATPPTRKMEGMLMESSTSGELYKLVQMCTNSQAGKSAEGVFVFPLPGAACVALRVFDRHSKDMEVAPHGSLFPRLQRNHKGTTRKPQGNHKGTTKKPLLLREGDQHRRSCC